MISIVKIYKLECGTPDFQSMESESWIAWPVLPACPLVQVTVRRSIG